MGKNVRKIVDANRESHELWVKKQRGHEANRESQDTDWENLQLDDKGISSLTDIDNNLSTLSHLTRLILAHNRLTKITQAIGDLKSLTLLNCFNNQIDELPANFHVLQKLRHLNLGMNRLNELPKRFNELKSLEMLDLTYNNLTEVSLGEHFFDEQTPLSKTIRILYLSDNDLKYIPMNIKNFHNLEILSVRDNDIEAIPDSIESLSKIHELHLQGNLLRLLPPEFGRLKDNLIGQKRVLKLERNRFILPLEEQRKKGPNILFNYLNSQEYRNQFEREKNTDHRQTDNSDRKKEKSKKISRVKA